MFKRFPNPICSTDSGQLCPSSSRWSSTLGRTLDDIFFREQKWNLASSSWQNSLKPSCSHNDTGWPCFTRTRSAKKSKSFSFLDFGCFMWERIDGCPDCSATVALEMPCFSRCRCIGFMAVFFKKILPSFASTVPLFPEQHTLQKKIFSHPTSHSFLRWKWL